MIKSEIMDGVAVLTLMHGKANALDIEFCDAIADRFALTVGLDEVAEPEDLMDDAMAVAREFSLLSSSAFPQTKMQIRQPVTERLQEPRPPPVSDGKTLPPKPSNCASLVLP